MKKFFYRVSTGDTLTSIADRFNVPVTLLIYENNLDSEVELGDMLYVQSEECLLYTVQPTDTLQSVAQKFNVDEDKIRLNNHVDYLFYGLKIKI